MDSNSKLWMIHNRFWLRNAAAAGVLSCLLIVLAVKSAPEFYAIGGQLMSTGQPSYSQLVQDLSAEQIRREQVVAKLDSLKMIADTEKPEETVLLAVQECCQVRQVTITGYDRLQPNSRAGGQIISYRLLIEGRFHALALLVADLEALSNHLTVQSLNLESKVMGPERLRGALVVFAGADK